MNALLKDKLLITLFVLLGLTALSWLSLNQVDASPEILGSFIIALAFLKLRIILIHFMELKKASIAIRLTFEAWSIAVAGITISIYLI